MHRCTTFFIYLRHTLLCTHPIGHTIEPLKKSLLDRERKSSTYKADCDKKWPQHSSFTSMAWLWQASHFLALWAPFCPWGFFSRDSFETHSRPCYQAWLYPIHLSYSLPFSSLDCPRFLTGKLRKIIEKLLRNLCFLSPLGSDSKSQGKFLLWFCDCRYTTELSVYVTPVAFGFLGIARTSSVYCTICVTLERYYATAKPFASNVWIKKKLMPLIFIFAIVYNIPK